MSGGEHYTPVKANVGDASFVAMGISSFGMARHMCVGLSDSSSGGELSLKCWGYNGDGQLGLGDTDNRGDDVLEMGSQLPVIYLTSRQAASHPPFPVLRFQQFRKDRVFSCCFKVECLFLAGPNLNQPVTQSFCHSQMASAPGQMVI
eukprot:scaffold161490_cov33-Prasinocladus_malaysianus.AAC.3